MKCQLMSCKLRARHSLSVDGIAFNEVVCGRHLAKSLRVLAKMQQQLVTVRTK